MKKEDLKQDVLTAELKKGFEWSTQHTKLLAVVFAVFIALEGFSLLSLPFYAHFLLG
jgi:hypothetical protein